MPEYTFQCDEEYGGCGHTFTKYMSIQNYTDKQTCPTCSKRKTIRRKLCDDLLSINAGIKKSDDEVTVGHLASRNTERMSDDEKSHLTHKHNEYRYTKPEHDLPDGMSRIGDPGKRKPSKKQHKKDRKRRGLNVKSKE